MRKMGRFRATTNRKLEKPSICNFFAKHCH